MEIRNIVVNGVTVGTLGFPEGTSEDVWAAASSAYAPPTADAAAAAAAHRNMDFGMSLIVQLASLGVSLNLTPTQQAATATKLAGIPLLLFQGALAPARSKFYYLAADDVLTPDIINSFVNQITAYLGDTYP